MRTMGWVIKGYSGMYWTSLLADSSPYKSKARVFLTKACAIAARNEHCEPGGCCRIFRRTRRAKVKS